VDDAGRNYCVESVESVAGFLKLILVYLSFTLFQWMFLSAECLELMADSDRILGPPGENARFVAYQFAAHWRHGMAENSWLYMPGFFAVALAGWHWAVGQPMRRLWLQGLALALAADLSARLLAPAGALLVIQGFEHKTGFLCQGAVATPSLRGSLVGLYTLITWCSFVIGSQRALSRRSLRPLLLTVILTLALALIRPWTVGDFTGCWLRAVLDGNKIAIVSLLAIPALAALLVCYQIQDKRGLPNGSTSVSGLSSRRSNKKLRG
jgi:hypothetical protein